jgi:hypothetical protein
LRRSLTDEEANDDTFVFVINDILDKIQDKIDGDSNYIMMIDIMN